MGGLVIEKKNLPGWWISTIFHSWEEQEGSFIHVGWPFFTLLSKAPRRLYRYIGGGGFSFHRRLIKVAISFASITCYRLLRLCVFGLFSILSLMAVVVVQSTMNMEKAEHQGSTKIENVLLVCV